MCACVLLQTEMLGNVHPVSEPTQTQSSSSLSSNYRRPALRPAHVQFTADAIRTRLSHYLSATTGDRLNRISATADYPSGDEMGAGVLTMLTGDFSGGSIDSR